MLADGEWETVWLFVLQSSFEGTGNKREGSKFRLASWRVDPLSAMLSCVEVNAYFSPSDNEIHFPAGILQPPFFGPDLPSFINYGAFGAVAAHEITRSSVVPFFSLPFPSFFLACMSYLFRMHSWFSIWSTSHCGFRAFPITDAFDSSGGKRYLFISHRGCI
jgi:hypothetical protein